MKRKMWHRKCFQQSRGETFSCDLARKGASLALQLSSGLQLKALDGFSFVVVVLRKIPFFWVIYDIFNMRGPRSGLAASQVVRKQRKQWEWSASTYVNVLICRRAETGSINSRLILCTCNPRLHSRSSKPSCVCVTRRDLAPVSAHVNGCMVLIAVRCLQDQSLAIALHCT